MGSIAAPLVELLDRLIGVLDIVFMTLGILW